MATLNILSANATKLLDQLEQDLGRLETGDAPASLQGQVSATLGNVSRVADDLEGLAKREIALAKREKALLRVSEVRDRINEYRRRLDSWRAEQQRIAKAQHDSSRNELLGGNATGNGAVDATTIPIGDYFIREGESLQNAGVRIDEYINSGRNALQELFEQRSMMKNAQRRILDIANSLGLSTSVLKFIERRGVQDKWILYGGMVATGLILLAIIYYLA